MSDEVRRSEFVQTQIDIETWERQMGYVLTRLDAIESAALKPEDIAKGLQTAIITAASSPET